MHYREILVVSAIIIGLLSLLWMTICALLEESVANTLAPPPTNQTYTFDYVVVGAGTAGSVLASLLAKHTDATVLLIEAGNPFGLLSRIPLLPTFQQKGTNDWAFLSVPQRFSSRGLEERRQCLPRGRGLGGSAQLNYMLHFDGSERDFANWSSPSGENLTEWRWEMIKPYLMASKAKPDEMFEMPATYSKLTKALREAEVELSEEKWHFQRARYNIKNGLRFSVFHRFLQPAMKQSNLRIMLSAMAKQIILSAAENGKEKQVEAVVVGVKDAETRKEITFSVHIRRELILSAGAYQSPQLLLVSGIGSSETLQKHKIPLQHRLPLVGKQLHDHLNLPLFVSIDVVGPTLNRRSLLDPLNLWRYLHSGGGPLGNFGVLGQVFGNVKVDDNQHPKRSSSGPPFGVTYFGTGAIDETALMSISNFKRSHFRALFPRYANASQEGFVMISTCLQPRSRGEVTIASGNIRQNPLINPNYLAMREDVNCTIAAVRAAVTVVAQTAAFAAKLRPRIHWPRLKECSNFGPYQRDFKLNDPSDRYLECVMRHVALGSHHPGGSCRMGNNASNSVVDGQFRVHGLRGLRIVDGSVLPTPISGNPNSIIVALAVRASAMIRQAGAEQQPPPRPA